MLRADAVELEVVLSLEYVDVELGLDVVESADVELYVVDTEVVSAYIVELEVVSADVGPEVVDSEEASADVD